MWLDADGNGAGDAFGTTRGVHRFPQVGAALSVEPEVGGVAEDLCQDERSVRSDRATVAAELIYVLAWDTGALGKIGLGEIEGSEELLGKDSSGG